MAIPESDRGRYGHMPEALYWEMLEGEDPDDRAIREAHGIGYDAPVEGTTCRNGCGLGYADIIAGKVRECEAAMTEIIIRGRQGGKTTALIRISAETGCYIVCTDYRRATQVVGQAADLGLRIPFPLTVSEWQKGDYHAQGVSGLLFDDLDKIIGMMSSVPVRAVTWTGEAGNAPNPGGGHGDTPSS